MPVIQIPRDDIFELEEVRRTILSTGRWTTRREYILKKDGRLYRVYAEFGSTETSGDFSDLNDKFLDATEVEAFEKTVVDYRPV